MLIDTKCLSYRLITLRFIRKNSLKPIKIRPITIKGFNSMGQASIYYIVAARTNIRGYKEVIYFYITDRLLDLYNLILGLL